MLPCERGYREDLPICYVGVGNGRTEANGRAEFDVWKNAECASILIPERLANDVCPTVEESEMETERLCSVGRRDMVSDIIVS